MKTPIRALLTAALAAVLIVPLAGPASAHDTTWLRSRAFSNGHDPYSIDTSMSIDDLEGPEAEVQTRATARSQDCEGCLAAAIAIHVVLIDGPLDDLIADNRAKAVNLRCDGCATLAASVQFVVAGPDRVWLTRSGFRQLQRIEWRIHDLTLEDDLVTEVQNATAQIQSILETEVRMRGVDGTQPLSAPEVQVQSDIQFG